MKKVILMMLVIASLWGKEFTQAQKDTLAYTVRDYGYSCERVDKAMYKGDGLFVVACNGYRYVYEIKDVGGRWQVKVR